ncbi:MAG TPA: FAD-dependent oxidoreductase [Acidimicrobiia bacterium]|nr:FAD-dependent oxidoreductase [Acidimicrobiia bacterium]
MSKPAILAVDDDPQVLAAVSRDLRQQYGEHYRVLRAASGAEGLATLSELQGRGDVVASFVVDQRMPEMSGTEFLKRAIELFPDAKKVLLTAYADTEAAISAINEVGLDHYLMKPWDPPEEHLYPVLDDLLEDWQADAPTPYDGIRVIGVRWSPDSYDVKDFLSRNQVPYRFLDVEIDPDARAIVSASDPAPQLPLVVFPDGERLERPDHRLLADRAGLQTEASTSHYDLVIVGAGPAGLGAAVYGASEGLRTALIERHATGGQAGTSSRIENYLGFPKGISGADLARRATAQAKRLGAEILTAVEATSVRVEDPTKILTLSNGSELSCRALLIATGMTIRKLEVPGAEPLIGAGIWYGAAVAEAVTYRGEDVFVVGGANSAGQAAMMLSKYAGTVTVLVRGASLEAQMSQYLIDQIAGTPNIRVLLNTQIAGVSGEGRLEAITLRSRLDGTEQTLDASGLFIFIGAVPHSDFVEGVVERDKRGFILTGTDLMVDGARHPAWPLDRDPFLLETSVPGIFAAGDVRANVIRRVASAVGQGAIGVSFIHKYLETA